jgi:hypothetical protein
MKVFDCCVSSRSRGTFGVRARPRVALGGEGRRSKSDAKTPRTPKALRAKCRGRIPIYPYPCKRRAELWEQRDRRKSREGSGERARVASEFQIRG